ncbi:MAG: methylmalonyl Co-A mutase-associated GTPase MeaB [SAR202 cluster bacterium]|nr:methylmalonyl Co-A mutase-associated GTPase MeaB [SAR202 cluster bacterium]
MLQLSDRLLKGDPRALSRALSLLERGDVQVSTLMQEVHHKTGKAYCIGVTGPPGAGKSTLIGRLTEAYRKKGLSVGIIAVDPTSPYSGGALLGDRIRMEGHYLDPGVFIRSMATRGSHGGLPRIIKAAARLLDASGKDVVLVETVGVGQTELDIMSVADTVVVTLVPEAGDSIQALKAGLMEAADIFVVNKADRQGAEQMAAAVKGGISTASTDTDWSPPVLLTHAHTGEGMDRLLGKLEEHRDFLISTSRLEERRRQRRTREFTEVLREELYKRIERQIEMSSKLKDLLGRVESGDLEPYSAARRCVEDASLLGGKATAA